MSSDQAEAVREIVEPTRKYAEVLTFDGFTFFRTPAGRWMRTDELVTRRWEDLRPVHVLSLGVDLVPTARAIAAEVSPQARRDLAGDLLVALGITVISTAHLQAST